MRRIFFQVNNGAYWLCLRISLCFRIQQPHGLLHSLSFLVWLRVQPHFLSRRPTPRQFRPLQRPSTGIFKCFFLIFFPRSLRHAIDTWPAWGSGFSQEPTPLREKPGHRLPHAIFFVEPNCTSSLDQYSLLLGILKGITYQRRPWMKLK